jgi:serine/threonine protein kinase
MSRVIVNLLEKMLSKDPKFRISAEEALKHEYFEGVGELLESEMEKEIHSVKN